METCTIMRRGILAALLCFAADARAADDDDEVTRSAKQHYDLGSKAFKAEQYADAIRELKMAYTLKRLPALLVNLGIACERNGEPSSAIYFYKKFLSSTPEDPASEERDDVRQRLAALRGGPPPKPVARPVAPAPPPAAIASDDPPPRRAPARAAEAARVDPAPAPLVAEAPADPPPPPPESEWKHEPVDAAPPGRPIDVRVKTPVQKGVKVFLRYRGKGEKDFNDVLMVRRGDFKVGRIPGEDVSGTAIQYYLEAIDGAGKPIHNSGSRGDPNIVLVDPDAPAQDAPRR